MNGAAVVSDVMRARTVLLLTVSLALPMAAERPQPLELELESKFLGERRRIMVSLPPSYPSGAERYPVLYLLDADTHFEHAASSADALAAVARMPELIIVGIRNPYRRRDLTPTRVADRLGENAFSGGAPRFGDFIELEVMPAVERRYRTQSYRIIAGHSLGGLFALDMLFTRPTLFDAWIVVSPTTFWDNDYIVRQARALSQDFARAEALLLINADEDARIMSGVQQLHEILSTSGLKNLTVSRRELPDDDHLTAPIAGFYTGLRVVFRSWFFRIDDADDPQELYWRAKDHYRKLRELYGFDVAIPEGRLERIARRLLDVNETVEAVCVLHELVTAYPASASGYDLLAAAHERRTLSTTRAQ